MAVQPWELERTEEPSARPNLRLLPPGPRGHPLPAMLVVLLVAGTLSIPVGRALLEGPPPPMRWSPRPIPASQITSLAPVRTMPSQALPRSREPVVGVMFVSCTRLWTARPDGSHRTLVLEKPGISSPTLAPGGRTVAFLAPGDAGPEIWMAAADGSETVRVGAIGGDAAPPEMGATGLSWSPDGKYIALAVTVPGYDRWTGGSAIFSLDLVTGQFDKVMSGSAPVWVKSHLGGAYWEEGNGPQLDLRRGIGRRLNSTKDELGAAFAPGAFTAMWEKDVAVLRRSRSDSPELVVKANYYGRREQVFAPPAGRSFPEEARVALSEDGAKVYVDLTDRRGEPDLGILDVSTGDWTVLDYAWGPAPSPVPTASGSLHARRARDAADDLLRMWDKKGGRAELLIGDRQDRSILPFKRSGYVLREPQKDGNGWIVPASVYGRVAGGFGYRHLSIAVESDKTRLFARPSATSEIRPIDTVEDAARALDEMLDAEIVAPAGLPEGAKLAGTPIYAYKYRGYESGSINLLVPTARRNRSVCAQGCRYAYLTVSYGEVSLALGCGGENNPRPFDLGGTPAMTDHLRLTNAIVWPATPTDSDHADFSVSGNVPEEVVTSVAAAMEATS